MQNRKLLCGFLAILAVGVAWTIFHKEPSKEKYLVEQGRVHGTMYKISYQAPTGMPVTESLDSLFHAFDLSLSTFNDSSIISRINRNDSTVEVDDWFASVFNTGLEVSANTDGAFDMTVAPLVNVWGFGFKKSESVTSGKVDSILKHVGYQKVKLVDKKVVKEDTAIMLDAAAIAKGFSCDVVAQYLESKGVTNYLVDIGGEFAIRGLNSQGKPWAIGIEKPIEDSTMMHSELQSVICMSDKAVATSGNYRQFYHKNGKKYSHTINPHTGYPVDHNLLSATVIAPDCKTADAYATAFMVMGLEKSLLLANRMQDLDAYFIYEDESGNMSVQYTDGFAQYFPNDAEIAATQEK